MDSHQYQALARLFHVRRLHPWLPEHNLFIQSELAKLKVLDPHDHDSFKAFYDQKMEVYKLDHPEDFPVEESKIEEKISDTSVTTVKESNPKKVISTIKKPKKVTSSPL